WQDGGQERIRYRINVPVSVYFWGEAKMRFMIFDYIINDSFSDVALQFSSIQITNADSNTALVFF
ncbi:hypothetical protein NL531_33015, partial [Klebsiella pneumoniae]|nr:hypothetical protein [Klebsiella pneumoniae]